jgi:hypothetical protein
MLTGGTTSLAPLQPTLVRTGRWLLCTLRAWGVLAPALLVRVSADVRAPTLWVHAAAAAPEGVCIAATSLAFQNHFAVNADGYATQDGV